MAAGPGGGVARRLRCAEAEGAAIIEIQRLDADLAEALSAARGGDERSVERERAQHARAVAAVLAGTPSAKSARRIQRAFRRWHTRQADTLAAQREAEARAKAAEDARAAEHDTEEDKAIIANLCKRQDLRYPTAAEVREALRMARGTKARMPEVVRVLRRRAGGAPAAARSGYNSPARAEKRARPTEPADANDLPLALAFMVHRERARAAPISLPSQTRRNRPHGEELVDNHDVEQLHRQINELRAENDAQAKKSAALGAQLSQANTQLSHMRVQLADAKLAAHQSYLPRSPAMSPPKDVPSAVRAEWDDAAAKIQSQYTRRRHMQDMRALMDATKRETASLKSTLADRNSQLQAYTSRIKTLEASNAQLVDQGGTQSSTIERLQEELRVLQEWQRSQHEFVADQQTMQEEMVEVLRTEQAEQLEALSAQHDEQLQAEADAHAAAAEMADSTHASAVGSLQSEIEAATQQSQEMASTYEQQVRDLREEMQEQAHESRISAQNQDLVLDEVALEAKSLRAQHADAVREHEEALAAHAAQISAHQASYAELQSEHDHHRTLAEAQKDEVEKLEISLESMKRAHAATHIQMEYQRMRAQQDSREIQKKQRSKFDQLVEKHELVCNEHSAAQQHILHNASKTIQQQFHRHQARRDMRNVLAAHRAQMETQDSTIGTLRQQLTAAESALTEETERLHELHRDSLSDLRKGHDEYIGSLRDEHEQTISLKLEEMRSQHALELDEIASEAAETAAGLNGQLREATEQHQSSMADLKRRFEAETAPLSQLHAIETEAREAKAEHDSIVNRNQDELRELEEQLSKWKELAMAKTARMQVEQATGRGTTADASIDKNVVKECEEAVPPEPEAELEPEPEPELEPEPEPELHPERSLLESTPRYSEEVSATEQARLESMPELQAARAKVIFRRYDEDANGYLNLRELREMMGETEPGHYMSPEEYARLCEILGCEESSGVSFEKFVTMYKQPLAAQLGCDITKHFAVVAGSWIFEMYDSDEDGYLNFAEAKKLQMDTVPDATEISFSEFEQLCKILGCRASEGVDVDTFIMAYCPPLCHQLGWDVAQDFSVVAGLMIAHQYDIDALNIVIPSASAGTGFATHQVQLGVKAGMERIHQLEIELEGMQQRITEALVQRDAAIRERDAVAREAQAAEQVALMTEKKLEGIDSKASSEPQIDPAVFEELGEWRLLAEQLHQHQLSGHSRSGRSLSSNAVDSLQADDPSCTTAVEAEMDAWIALAQSLSGADASNSSSMGCDTEDQVVAALGVANDVVASAKVVRSEVEELQTKLDSVESERDELRMALETAETVESTAVLEAVGAMEKAQVATNRCRDRVAELQQVVDEKDRAINDHRQARQRLEEDIAKILTDVTHDAQTVQKLDNDYRIALEATQKHAAETIKRAKLEITGVEHGAKAAIQVLEATVQSKQQPPRVARLNPEASGTADGAESSSSVSTSPANMPQLSNSPPTTVASVAGGKSMEAQHVRSLQLQDEMEISNSAKQQQQQQQHQQQPTPPPPRHPELQPPSQSPPQPQFALASSAPQIKPMATDSRRQSLPALPGMIKVTFAQKLGPLGIAWQEMALPPDFESDASYPLSGRTVEDRTLAVVASLKPGRPASQGAFQGPKIECGLGLAAIESGEPGSFGYKHIDAFSLTFNDVVAAIRVSPRPVTMVLFATEGMRLSLVRDTPTSRTPPLTSSNPEVVAAAASTTATHDVTITQSGTMGVAWKQMTIGTGANCQSWPMIKEVRDGSVGAAAGLQAFQVLSAVNGQSMDSATTPYDQAIGILRSTRPLRLSFMAEKAAIKATVTFVSAGPLGLQLEPTTGNPHDPGVKLKLVQPTSCHANNPSLLPGLRLIALQEGTTTKQVTEQPYGEVVALLKAAGRPLTLTFNA